MKVKLTNLINLINDAPKLVTLEDFSLLSIKDLKVINVESIKYLMFNNDYKNLPKFKKGFLEEVVAILIQDEFKLTNNKKNSKLNKINQLLKILNYNPLKKGCYVFKEYDPAVGLKNYLTSLELQEDNNFVLKTLSYINSPKLEEQITFPNLEKLFNLFSEKKLNELVKAIKINDLIRDTFYKNINENKKLLKSLLHKNLDDYDKMNFVKTFNLYPYLDNEDLLNCFCFYNCNKLNVKKYIATIVDFLKDQQFEFPKDKKYLKGLTIIICQKLGILPDNIDPKKFFENSDLARFFNWSNYQYDIDNEEILTAFFEQGLITEEIFLAHLKKINEPILDFITCKREVEDLSIFNELKFSNNPNDWMLKRRILNNIIKCKFKKYYPYLKQIYLLS